MNVNDSSEHENERPFSNMIKLYYDTQSSDSSQDVEGKTAVQKKRERQRRYREHNREKLRLREAERRKRQQNFVIIAEPTNTNRIELNNEEVTHDISQSSNLGGTQTSSIQKNEQTEEKNALQKKRECQQRYREQNREKLKQRAAERRQYQKKIESIAKSNIECIVVISEAIEDEEK